MEGEGEIKALIQVWSSVFVCLAYCYFVVRKLPKGLPSLLAILPITPIFVSLPLLVSSVHFIIIITGFITWVCSFKLALFALGQGPLSCDPSISFLRFFLIASLPIQVKQQSSPPHLTKVGPKSTWNYIIKASLLMLIIQGYNYRQYIHPTLIMVMNFFHVYFAVEVILAISAVPARIIFGVELEAQFDDPHMATSVQDFWGRRWNLMVSRILRATVYIPVRSTCAPIMGPDWALSVGLLSSFVVSGLMHELLYFYLTRVKPTWEVTMFFVLQGVCTCVEVRVKKASGGRWQVHPIISRFLSVGFVMLTSFWLFFPPVLRHGILERTIPEYSSLVRFLKGIIF